MRYADPGHKIADLKSSLRPSSALSFWQSRPHATGSCPSSPEVIQISFSDNAPRTLPAHVMAYALPIEGSHVVVFYDRVKAGRASGLVGPLLAYVLVHEITHILQGVGRHSTSGIMKARWTDEDLFNVQVERLTFTQDDIDLIGIGMASRHAR